MKSFSTLLLPLALAGSALAHGFVATITIDGKAFKGDVPNAAKNPSIIRQISHVDPVKGATNAAVNCGFNAGPASLVADAMPGSTVTFDWRGGDLSNWPHNTGPMLTYMASCGDTTCDKFDTTQAKWFKIQQVGRKPNSADWAQADLMKGGTAAVTLPKTLAPGNYMIRHEIIALHLANSKGGAEFYPSCAQLRVGGSQTGKPTTDELVSLPGAYSDNDAGIFDPDVFNAKATYVFPGPKIAAFVNGDASNNGNDNSPSPTATSGASKPTQTKSSGTCKLKKKVSASASAKVAAAAASIRPRHLSRVMRGLVANHALPS
ncbi:putative glycosyl hydrolase family 61 [Lyophyllum shimeji]|uniref:lytic cellulose monooxygenase (C4-dehydrogenating) n=1 Tax=Lyophyllum shimeji TaxID=47721 RepID=A0A9P3PSP3_LYOSH|nr:putative glycosyl hydrolase family 61 [Lyophyllum shimeji]